MPPPLDPAVPVFSVAIGSGTSLSGEIDIGNWTPVGLFVPANWTTAGITFQASPDGGATWGELVDQTNTAIAVTSITGGVVTFVGLDPTKLRGVRALKVRSGTAGAAVNQTNSVTLTLLGRYIS